MDEGKTINTTEAAQATAAGKRRRYIKLWIRILAVVLVVALIVGITSVDFSVLKYEGTDQMVAAQFLLSSTTYINENRYERLKSLLTGFSSYEINLQAADVAIAKSDYRRAASFLTKCISICENTAETEGLYNRLGCVYMMEAMTTEAGEAFDKSIALVPDGETAYILRAQLRYNDNDLQGALSDAKKFIDLGGSDLDMLAAAESLCELCGDLESAVIAVDRMIENAPDDTSRARYSAELGRVRYLQGFSEDAVKDINTARKLDASVLAGVHYAIAALYEFDNEDYKMGGEDFLKAAQLSDSDNAQYYEQAILCAYLAEDYETLDKVAAEAEEKGMMSPLSLMLEGVVQFLNQDYEKAEDTLTRSIETGDITAEVYYYRGLARLAMGEYEDGAADFAISAERGENELESIYNRGVCYYAAGDYEKASEYLLYVINDGTNEELALSAYQLIEPFIKKN